MCESLILLVGSNPLPNYLAAMALKPARIHLVHSDATNEPKQRLFQALSDDLKPPPIIDADAVVNDAFSSSDVYHKVADLMDFGGGPQSVHLHYTGGTKVMSAHALKAFYDNDGKPENASYLDESAVCLRFDGNRESASLSDLGVTLRLNRVLQLHGIDGIPGSLREDGPTEDDVEAIAAAVLREPTLKETLYEASGELKKHKDKPDKAVSTAFEPATAGIVLSVTKIPMTTGWSRDRFKAWWQCLEGKWLEDWVARRARGLAVGGAPTSEVVVGVMCVRRETGREFEVDVAAMRGQRSYLVSCTTDQTLKLCKSKAFEIAARSRQMGGDLSRSALVCLLHGEDKKGKFVDHLRADVADVWGATNTTRIFGLEDVRTWAGQYGPPNLDSLKDWLQS